MYVMLHISLIAINIISFIAIASKIEMDYYLDCVLELSQNIRNICFNLIYGHVVEVTRCQVILTNIKCV